MQNNTGITPASLIAMLSVIQSPENSENMENFIAASTPGGIEAQEKRGQHLLCKSQRLPKEWQNSKINSIEELKKIGFQFLETGDDIFIDCIFPEGWKLEPTDHDMWSNLIDPKGRKRASIFYKAAFYDRSSHGSLNNAVTYQDQANPENLESIYSDKNIKSEYYNKYRNIDKNSEDTLPLAYVIYLQGKPIWSKIYTYSKKVFDWKNEKDYEGYVVRKEAEKWLKDNYPEWENPTMYWDE